MRTTLASCVLLAVWTNFAWADCNAKLKNNTARLIAVDIFRSTHDCQNPDYVIDPVRHIRLEPTGQPGDESELIRLDEMECPRTLALRVRLTAEDGQCTISNIVEFNDQTYYPIDDRDLPKE